MASRFWVGGAGTWDSSTTTHWAAGTGGAGGQSVPGTSDTVTFDGASGGGTVTVNTTVTVQSLTCGAHTGTLDFSANNNDVTLSAGANAFNGSGTGTRTLNLGNGTWTLNGNSASWNLNTTTNLTFNANSSNIVLSGNTTTSKTFTGGSVTYATVTLGPNISSGGYTLNGATTIATLIISAPSRVVFNSGNTTTITTLTCNGSSSAQNSINGSSTAGATISVASGTPSISWTAINDMIFTGGATFLAADSFNLRNNTGITITPPLAAGSNAPLSRVFTGL